MNFPVDDTVKSLLNTRLDSISNFLNAEVISYTGVILENLSGLFLKSIEERGKTFNYLFTPSKAANFF
jgi:hypothetical protein